jgi:hypothetical protein
VQVNTWGGTTKEYYVDVDLQKMEAYGVTLPQVISALGNANINVGGRTINVGQQSVNVRGVGLMDSGGETDLTQGYKVRDIENVMLSVTNGLPIFVTPDSPSSTLSWMYCEKLKLMPTNFSENSACSSSTSFSLVNPGGHSSNGFSWDLR